MRHRILLMLFLGILLSGCSGPDRIERRSYPDLSAPPPGAVVEESYRIGLGDALAIKFLLNPELNTEVTVRPDGKVVLPLIGEVAVSGLTLEELRQTASTKYQNFVNQSRYGEVLKEGDYFDLRFIYNPELNIGVRIPSDGSVSLPMVGEVKAAGRQPEELRQQLIASYRKYIKKPDIALLVGDTTAKKIHFKKSYLTIALTKATAQEVFVGGEINAPKLIKLEGRLTAIQGIMKGGGIKDSGDLSRVVILRRGYFEKPEWIQTNLAEPLKGNSILNDVELRGGDVVIVPKTGIAKLNQYVREYIRDLLPIPGSFGVSLQYYIEYPVWAP
ncbi:polysaccharide biosynthesis/export family protein [Desulfobacca acetoxidans]|uniref:Polysaccharide export protein n=1 Tax=Desulfobacca acetoxidans (strain ATCC 700848 / DSM 11109 / ASRB2) TaxID=880072 RepID=F2NHJ9_DESAR|nr:polysaccharide biosynthesis/export family protein [Desulfobacca acetoxidans]AEB09186.1 polysaccharide export protein [Desulfobacca acetoxidans DSM 11109]